METPRHQTADEFDRICKKCPLPPKLIGEKTFLTAFDPDQARDLTRFFTDETTAQGFGKMSKVIPVGQQRATLQNSINDFEHGYGFAIWDKRTFEMVGCCSLSDMSPVRRTATASICIGERKSRGKGLGTDAMRQLVSFAFEELGLENVMLTVYEFNEPAIRSYEKVGFKEFGRRRSSYYCHGRRWDTVFMDMTRGDYDEAQPRQGQRHNSP